MLNLEVQCGKPCLSDWVDNEQCNLTFVFEKNYCLALDSILCSLRRSTGGIPVDGRRLLVAGVLLLTINIYPSMDKAPPKTPTLFIK